MRNKKTTVELTIGFRKYLDIVTKKYLARRESLANTYLEVEYSPVGLFSKDYNRENNDVEYFPIKQRFTKLYGNSIYQKLKVLSGRNLYSFWTLTSRVDGTMLGFHEQHELIKKGWRDFRSLMAKVGLRGVQYLRCYELTDNFGLHIHIAFYITMSEHQVKVLAEYWTKHKGFVKIFLYSNHHRVWETSVMKQAFEPYKKDLIDYGQVWADRVETWVVAGKVGYRRSQKVRIDGKVAKYVWKYLVKVASVEKQAILWDNRIRSYACSKSLNASITIMRNDWKEKNKIERGYLVRVGMFKQRWLEDVQWQKEFSKKMHKKFIRPIDLNTIELVLSIHGFEKNKIHLEVSFNADIVAFHDIDWYSTRRQPQTGFVGFRSIDWTRFFDQSDEDIARAVLLRHFADRFRCVIDYS